MKIRIDALLLLVAAAGYVATSGIAVDLWRFSLLMIAGLLGAGGASATNHYLDRDIDSVMHRTRTWPLPQHRIEPPAHALAFGVRLLALSLAIGTRNQPLDGRHDRARLRGLHRGLHGRTQAHPHEQHRDRRVRGLVPRARGVRGRREFDQPPGSPDRPARVPMDTGTLLGPRVPKSRRLPPRAPADAPGGLG